MPVTTISCNSASGPCFAGSAFAVVEVVNVPAATVSEAVPAAATSTAAATPIDATNGSQKAINLVFRFGTQHLPLPFNMAYLCNPTAAKTKVYEKYIPSLTFVIFRLMLLLFSKMSIGGTTVLHITVMK
jgi:hypothetical protein